MFIGVLFRSGVGVSSGAGVWRGAWGWDGVWVSAVAGALRDTGMELEGSG